MLEKTPVRARRRRNSDLHTPLSASPKICKTTPRRTPVRTPTKGARTEPPKQRLRTPKRALSRSGKSPNPRKRWSVGSGKSASQGPPSARTARAKTPVDGTPRSNRFPRSSEEASKIATPGLGQHSAGRSGLDPATCSTDRSKSETVGSHGSHRHDFGFAPGVEDTLAFQVPSMLWHQRMSHESDSGLSHSPNNAPQLEESTEMIIGFSSDAPIHPDTEESGPPTEALFPTAVLGGRLSPVQEEDDSAPNWNQSRSIATTLPAEDSDGDTKVVVGSEAGDDAADAMKGLAIRESTPVDGGNQNGSRGQIDEDENHPESIGHCAGQKKSSTPAPEPVEGRRMSASTGQAMEREHRRVTRKSDPNKTLRKLSPAPKVDSTGVAPTRSPSPAKKHELLPLTLSSDCGCWEGDLRNYLEARMAVSSDTLRQRVSLVNALQSDPSSSSNWWNFLFHEERLDEEGDGFELDMRRVLAGHVPPSLYTMYLWAVRLLSPDSQDYVKIWIGYCRQVWWRNESEGTIFLHSGFRRKYGRNQVCLLEEIVNMECAAGKESRALNIVEMSIRSAKLTSHAVDQELTDIISRIKNGEYTTYRPRCNISGDLNTIQRMVTEYAV